jgi:hypothetical protein
MAFTANIHALPAITSYEQAKKWFDKTAKPPRSVKWNDHERPLKDVSAWHYRLERGVNEAYFDVCLYHTKMIRYLKPDQFGYRLVYIRGDNSKTSRKFLARNVSGSYGGEVASYVGEDNKQCVVPFSHIVHKHYKRNHEEIRHGNELFSAMLKFNPAGQLVVSESDHIPVCRRIVSKERKQERAEFRKQIETVKLLALYRLDTYRANASWDYRGAFSKSIAANDINDLQRTLRISEIDEELEFILTDVGQSVFDNVYSVYLNNNDLILGSRWSIGGQSLRNSPKALASNITDKQFLAAFERALLKAVRLDTPDDYEALPKFAELPRKFFW